MYKGVKSAQIAKGYQDAGSISLNKIDIYISVLR